MQTLNTKVMVNSNSLTPHTVHIWTITLNSTPEKMRHYESLLSSHEITRANQFRTAELRNRYAICRGRLREILASYTCEMHPEMLVINTNAFGKPFLENMDNIHFNYAHSENIAMIAVAQNRPVGIDIEKHINIDIDEIAHRLFLETEIAKLQTLPYKIRQQFFFRLWARKEAYVKALGKGLGQTLKDFSVCSELIERKVKIHSPDMASTSAWGIEDVSSPEGFSAALCSREVNWQYLHMSHYSVGAHS